MVSTVNPSKTADLNVIDNDDKEQKEVFTEYINVSKWLFILSVMYLGVNSVMMVTFILNNFVKAKRGCLYYIKTMYHFMSVPYFVTMIFMLYQRCTFTNMVCLCTFKDDYLSLRDSWKLELTKNPHLKDNS